MNNTFSLLSICRRAGKLAMGMDSVKEACADKTICCVLVSSDLSEKSLKEVRFICEKSNVKIFCLDEAMNEIWAALGKKSGILGVCDKGFSKKLEAFLKPDDSH